MYVQRNEAEEIVGAFFIPIEGVAEEFIEDDDSELLLFLENREGTMTDYEQRITNLETNVQDHENRITTLEGA